MHMISHRLIISGRVQGVGFRAFIQHHAEKLGLDGFVRNRRNESVEALVWGDADNVQTLIALCHEGPPASKVDKVEITEAQDIVDKGFRQLPTV